MNWRASLALGVGIVITVGTMTVLQVYHIGPRVVWATDMCPAPNVTCGILPVGWIVAVALGALTTLTVGNRLSKPRGETA